MKTTFIAWHLHNTNEYIILLIYISTDTQDEDKI